MKKTLLLFCACLLLAGTNSFAALTPTLTFPYATGNPVVTYPNSTVYPNYYEVRMLVQANTACVGTYSIGLERRQTSPVSGAWITVTANEHTPATPPPAGTSYSRQLMIYQLEGYTYEYRIKVSFVPTGTTCVADSGYTNIRTVQVKGKSHADFTINGQAVPTDGSPISVCFSQPITINASATTFETQYYVGVAESNLWWARTGKYEWGKWFSGTAPANISLQTVISQNLSGFTAPLPADVAGNITLSYLLGGMLNTVGFEGQERYYRVSVCTNEPEWECKTVLIKVNMNCRMAAPTAEEPESTPKTAFSLFPNPVRDVLNISVDGSEYLKSVSIYNFSNILIKKELASSKHKLEKIDLSDLKKGLYIVEIETDKGIKREKIIKE